MAEEPAPRHSRVGLTKSVAGFSLLLQQGFVGMLHSVAGADGSPVADPVEQLSSVEVDFGPENACLAVA